MAIHFYSATLWHGLVLCGIDYDVITFMEVATRPIESLLDRSLSDDFLIYIHNISGCPKIFITNLFPYKCLQQL